MFHKVLITPLRNPDWILVYKLFWVIGIKTLFGITDLVRTQNFPEN